MLILTRRVGEKLFIGDDIAVMVLGVKGNQVRLGFDAPDHVNILREELVLRDAAAVIAGMNISFEMDDNYEQVMEAV